MSLTTTFGSQTQITRALAEQLEAGICAAAKIQVTDQLQCIIDSIPFVVMAAATSGSNFARLLTLTEGTDFNIPEEIEPYKTERPAPDWLTGDAAIAFRYCKQVGLSPRLEPFTQPLTGLLKCDLTVDWAPSFLESTNKHDTTFSLDAVKTSLTSIPYPEQTAVRKRVAKLLLLAPEILQNARVALAQSHKNGFILRVCDEKASDEELYELMRDIRILCDLFAMPVTFTPMKHIRLDQPMKRFDVHLR